VVGRVGLWRDPALRFAHANPRARVGAKGRLLSTLLAAIAEFERELIRERTGEGRRRAMANGVKFGRKPKLSPYQRAEAIKRRAAGETLASIARSYAVDLSMISRL
jgi:DNA invertase Pin-like site-specific DNA recombinase